MTISSDDRVAGPYAGNDSATAFAFSFKVFTTADVRVVFTATDGIETDLTLTTDYTVSLNSDQDNNPGGTVTYPASGSPLATGEKLTITSGIANTQPTDITNLGGFYPNVLEDMGDRSTIQIQQLAEKQGRSLTIPISAASGVSTQMPAPEASKLIGWDANATALANFDVSALATVVAYANWRTEVFNGAAASYVLAANPGNQNNCDVSVSGVTQTPGVDFTVSGTTLTPTTPWPSGTNNVTVRYGEALPQGSISAAMTPVVAALTTASALSQLGGLSTTTAASTYAPINNPTFTGDPKAPTPAATDSDTSIATTAFAKVIRGYVNVKDYGAVGDGSNDDTTAFANAISAGDTVVVPWTSASYLITNSLTLSKAVTIMGLNQDAKLTMAAAMSNPLFNISGNDIHVERLKIVGNGTQTNSIFRFKTNGNSPTRVFIDDIITSAAYRFADDENSSGQITSLYVRRCQHKQPLERTILFYDAIAFIFFEDFAADYVGVSAASSNVPAIAFENNVGSIFTNVEVTGGTIAGMSSRWGFGFTNCAAVWLQRAFADTMGGYGFRFSGCTDIHFNDIGASLCDQHGVLITGTTGVFGTKIYTGGSNAVGGATANQHGLYITGSSDDINLTCIRSRRNTGNGVLIDGSSVAKLSDLRANNNTGRGYKTSSATASILNGAQFGSNTAGNYDLGGTLDHMTGAQLTSGALVATVTGAATG